MAKRQEFLVSIRLVVERGYEKVPKTTEAGAKRIVKHILDVGLDRLDRGDEPTNVAGVRVTDVIEVALSMKE